MANNTLLAVTAGNVDKLATVLSLIVEAAAQHRDIRSPLLSVLNSAPADFELSGELRVKLLRTLWSETNQPDRDKAFSFSYGESSDMQQSVLQIRTAALNLLRTADDAEWDYVFLPAFGNSPDIDALSAWAMRIKLDIEVDKDVTWAADKLLVTKPILGGNFASGRHELLLKLGIESAGKDTFDAFSKEYVETASVDTQKASPSLTRSIVQRLVREDEIGPWIEEQLTPDHHRHEFQTHVLKAVIAAYGGDIKGEHREIWRDILALRRPGAGFLQKHVSEIQRATLRLLASRIEETKYWWDVIFAIETSGVLVEGDLTGFTEEFGAAVSTMRDQLRWIGSKLPQDTPIVTLTDSFSEQVGGGANQEDGGTWVEAHVEEPLTLALGGAPEGSEIVAFDLTREHSLARGQATQNGERATIQLDPGIYALALRSHGNTSALVLKAFKGPIKVSAKIGDPQNINGAGEYEVTINTDDLSGTVDLRVQLHPGMVLVAETSEGKSGNGADTFLSLTDIDTNESLRQDDDGGEGGYSQMIYYSDAARSVSLVVSHCCEAEEELSPGTSILLNLAILGQADMLIATPEAADAPTLRPNDVVVLRFFDGDGWVRAELPEAGIYRLETRLGLEIHELSSQAGPDSAILLFGSEGEYAIATTGPIVANLRASSNSGVSNLSIEKQVDALRIAGSGETPFEANTDMLQTALLVVPPEGAEVQYMPTSLRDGVEMLVFDPHSYGGSGIRIARDSGGRAAEITPIERIFGRYGTLHWQTAPGASDTLQIASTMDGTPSMVVANYDLSIVVNDGFELGDRVVLGRHDYVDGENNWNPSMDKYVGCIAQIVHLVGPEYDTGAYLAEVNLRYEEGEREWLWRTRSMIPAPPSLEQPESCLEHGR